MMSVVLIIISCGRNKWQGLEFWLQPFPGGLQSHQVVVEFRVKQRKWACLAVVCRWQEMFKDVGWDNVCFPFALPRAPVDRCNAGGGGCSYFREVLYARD